MEKCFINIKANWIKKFGSWLCHLLTKADLTLNTRAVILNIQGNSESTLVAGVFLNLKLDSPKLRLYNVIVKVFLTKKIPIETFSKNFSPKLPKKHKRTMLMEIYLKQYILIEISVFFYKTRLANLFISRSSFTEKLF